MTETLKRCRDSGHLLVYRVRRGEGAGFWCPFCQAYTPFVEECPSLLQQLEASVAKVRRERDAESASTT